MSAVQSLRPASSQETASRLQVRLSVFGLVIETLIGAAEFLTRIDEQLRAGFALSEEDRHKLTGLALVLFDAREVLGGS